MNAITALRWFHHHCIAPFTTNIDVTTCVYRCHVSRNRRTHAFQVANVLSEMYLPNSLKTCQSTHLHIPSKCKIAGQQQNFQTTSDASLCDSCHMNSTGIWAVFILTAAASNTTIHSHVFYKRWQNSEQVICFKSLYRNELILDVSLMIFKLWNFTNREEML